MKLQYFLWIPFLFLIMLIPSYGQPPEISISIPQEGTSEFCGKFHTCFIPIEVLTQVGAKVTWTNDDLAATHTVTSGDVVVGPDGIFDSGPLGPTNKYSYTFEETGIFPYYCTIHPWKEGLVKIAPITSAQESFSQLSDIEKIKQENVELKRQIQELQEEITKLRQLVAEQMKVIFEWISIR